MKKFYFVFYFFASIIPAVFSQAGEWVWIHGNNTSGSLGSYGTQGVASATNEPASLYETIEWTDKLGNFWFYGGVHPNNYNDLWKYDPVADQWTWMSGTHSPGDPGVYGTQGIPSPTNRPPARGWGAVSWVDTTGNFWMFGGLNVGPYSDLWKYDVSTNEWTWMKGPSTTGQTGTYGTRGVANVLNNPGSRSEVAAAWTGNNNNLWLFGGYDWGNSGGVFNDMWRYDISTNNWIWMKGSSTTSAPGVYGTQTVEDSLNTPGGRFAYCRWKDRSGNFWLFGGADYPAGNYMSDLWRFNPVTNNWTWMKGSTLPNTAGVYGTKCVTSPTNLPGPRMENRAAWMDTNGNLWMLGGYDQGGQWNDLWMYCMASNQWTWEGGDTTIANTGSWGTKNVSSSANKPNGRMGASGWTDNNGHLYLFGGYNPAGVTYNDLWKFTIDPACGTCSQSAPTALFNCSDTAFCTETGECINFYDHSTGNPTSWQWSFPGAAPDSSTQQNPMNICYNNPGTYPVTLIISNTAGTDTLAVSPLIIYATTPAPPNITIFGGDTLVSSLASSYQWYLNGFPLAGATDSFYVAMQAGTYAVRITDSLGCSVSSGGVFVTGISSVESAAGINLYPNPASDELFISFGKLESKIEEVIILDIYGRRITKIILDSQLLYRISTKNLSNGIYFLELTGTTSNYRYKFVVVHK